MGLICLSNTDRRHIMLNMLCAAPSFNLPPFQGGSALLRVFPGLKPMG